MAEKPDPELDELLDSAAKDFQKPEQASSSAFDPSQFLNADGSMNIEKWKKFQEEQEKVSEALYKQAEDEFESSDLAKELTQKLQEGLASAAEEQGITPEEIANSLKNLKLFGGEGPAMGAGVDKEFSDTIMGAMQSLRENLSEAFPAAREGEDGDGEDASANEMENLTTVMQQMFASLSKEMMLPSFKEMSEKYPAWLEENKSKLGEAELKRYTDQFEVVQQIVGELEKDKTDDNDKKHLDRIMELMGKLQELGQPPQDLVAQLGNAIDDSKIDAMLKDSGADQCNIM